MKAPGLAFGCDDRGGLTLGLTLGLTPTNRAIDKLWDAVEEAVMLGMDPARFKREMVEAWEHHRKEQTKWELQELRK